MATYNKHNGWAEAVAEAANCGTDQFVLYLTNTAPTAANSILSDITQVSYTNCSSRNLTTASSSQTAGTYSLSVNDLTLTASGGTVGPFRYVGVYDDTVTSPVGPLVCWFDYGSSITLADTETFLFDLGANLFTIA